MKMINVDQFDVCFNKATNYNDADAFVSDMVLSSMFNGIGNDEDVLVSEELVTELKQIYRVAHLSVADIRKELGLSRPKFSKKFLIPLRTLENWEADSGECKRECKPYIILLLANACGMINI